MKRTKAYAGDDPYIFISYSHKDIEVLDYINELAMKDYRIWYDEGIKSGSDWADVITKHIKNCTQFIVFLSENSINSENVKDEIHLAVKYKKDMLVVHLENVILDGGLELHLDRKQALLKYTFNSSTEFSSHLCDSINNKTIRILNHGAAECEFKNQYEILKPYAVDSFSKTFIAMKKSSSFLVLAKFFYKDTKIEKPSVIAREEKHILQILQDCPFTPFVIDYYEDDENAILVKTYIEGGFLNKLTAVFDFKDIEKHQELCVDIILSVAETLTYLHNAKDYKIVHCDIKPDNILVNPHIHAIITDFDLCKILDNYNDGMVWGTKGYAAPEQYNGVVDCRSDIYALGITLCEIVTGRSPTKDPCYDVQQVLYEYANNKKYSPTLINIILKMTQIQPSDRYQTIEEVIYDLKHYREKDLKSAKKYKKSKVRRNKSLRQTV